VTLDVLFCSLVFAFAAFDVLLHWRATRSSLCWGLVYLARGLEFVKRCWGSVVLESPLRRWTTRPTTIPKMFRITPLGQALYAPVAWMYPAAVSLVVFANRYLPPLGPDDGFLKRLYPRPGDW